MKILGSDFDGTFNYKGIDDTKKAAVAKWRSCGNYFSIVSGRSVSNIINVIKNFDFECDFLVAHNGAAIAKLNGEIISSIKCNGELALPLINLVFENGCGWAYVGSNFEGKVYIDEAEGESNGGYTMKNLPDIPWFTQISVQCEDEISAKKLTEIIRNNFGDKLNPLQNGICIDIVDISVNKAKGIYNLMDYVGAKYDDVIVVGDNVNDYDMIKEFKSYAMENGVDSIKKIANFTTNSVTELIEKELLV